MLRADMVIRAAQPRPKLYKLSGGGLTLVVNPYGQTAKADSEAPMPRESSPQRVLPA